MCTHILSVHVHSHPIRPCAITSCPCVLTCCHIPYHRFDNYNTFTQKVTIALVGKYTKLSDSYISVEKALKHAALSCRQALDLQYIEAGTLEEGTKEEDPQVYHSAWGTLCRADGILVPGGFGARGTEGKILAIEYARTKKKPYLGEWEGGREGELETLRASQQDLGM